MDGVKEEEKKKGGSSEKEGSFLLGLPKYVEIGNGRLRCSETGHELPAKEAEAYSRSKACRLALIDAAVSKKKPPLNTFKPHPLSKSKLVCELTGDTINKSEEHIWKHISGRRFQNKLEQKEAEKLAPVEEKEKGTKKSRKLSKSSLTVGKDDRSTKDDGNASSEGKPMENISDLEKLDFWVPPVGDRWDCDDGKDRWESCTTSDHETDKEDDPDEAEEQPELESLELSAGRTKRTSIEVGPSSFASRKKKKKSKIASCDL
ncbi:surfeit locus protein 2-like [Iris pallida]|uniref:Surfeit locus protein 2-like n=1 Tax=Iris pallida TaxID=29817 RepID=A0AAX6FZ62_IRIPA|nr:surfeit locus protein 2-like [Iris pallida]